MEVDKIISQIMVDFKEEKFLEKIIRKRLEKTLEDIVKDLLESWSPFGRKLKDHIQKEMIVNLDKLSLPEYNTLVINWVKEIIQGNINEVAREQIEKNLKTFLAPIEKKEWKLSEIINKFKEDLEDEENRYGTEISFHCEQSKYEYNDDKSYHIYFDDEEDLQKYQCDHNIYVANGKLSSIRSSRGDILKSKFKEFYGFDAFLFQLHSADVTIEIDEDCVDTKFGDY